LFKTKETFFKKKKKRSRKSGTSAVSVDVAFPANVNKTIFALRFYNVLGKKMKTVKIKNKSSLNFSFVSKVASPISNPLMKKIDSSLKD